MSRNHPRSGYADPYRLRPFDKDDGDIINAIIETPKGSRNIYAYDPDDRIFLLRRVLPAGMGFPYDFGFVPSTKAGDGDPVDVLILMDEPAFIGCLVKTRPIGIIEGEQIEEKKNVNRNDRIVVVEIGNHTWSKIQHIDDLGKKFIQEIEHFFVSYHELQGKKYKILDVKGPKAAYKAVNRGIKSAKKR